MTSPCAILQKINYGHIFHKKQTKHLMVQFGQSLHNTDGSVVGDTSRSSTLRNQNNKLLLPVVNISSSLYITGSLYTIIVGPDTGGSKIHVQGQCWSGHGGSKIHHLVNQAYFSRDDQ